jgi:Golgi phosphoprotein 3 GPP34
MTTDLPSRLPDRAFLIAYDVQKKKLTGNSQGQLIRAAALVELTLAGQLVDVKGRPRVVGGRTDDPVLNAVLDQIDQSKPRTWRHWVEKDAKITYQAVRERLATARVISVTEGTVLGIFQKKIVTVRDTRIVRELVADLRRVVIGGSPTAQLDPRDLLLVPLVAAVELNTVFTGRERREHRDRIKELAERAGPAAKALRKVVESQQATVAAV